MASKGKQEISGFGVIISVSRGVYVSVTRYKLKTVVLKKFLF